MKLLAQYLICLKNENPTPTYILNNNNMANKTKQLCGDIQIKVDFYFFLDIIDCSLVMRRYSNQNNKWMAQIEHCEIKEGAILSGNYGTGKSPDEAIKDYVNQIKGKHIVINATTQYRKDFFVPAYIYFEK